MEENKIKKVEAILFVSGRFLNMGELITLSQLNPSELREIIEQIKMKYEGINSVIQIIEKGENDKRLWKMDIDSEYSSVVSKLATGSDEFSKAEQETLAIIAFKFPIKQSVVIRIRGNKAYDHIKRFSELGMIKKKRSGRTWELTLSEEFYNYFNVSEKEIKSNLNKENSDFQ